MPSQEKAIAWECARWLVPKMVKNGFNSVSARARAPYDSVVETFHKCRNDVERLILLDKELPNTETFSDFKISCSGFDQVVRKHLELEDDEEIFLIINGIRNVPGQKNPSGLEVWQKGLICFTSDKMLFLMGLWHPHLLDCAYLLSFCNERLTEKGLIEEEKDTMIKRMHSWLSRGDSTVEPMDYDSVHDLRVDQLGRILFRRKDRESKDEFYVKPLGLVGLPDPSGLEFRGSLKAKMYPGQFRVVIKRRVHPNAHQAMEKLAELKPNVAEVISDSNAIFLCKLCIDALRLIPKQKKEIARAVFAWKECKDLYLEKLVQKESYTQLKCEHCGAGIFDESKTTYGTPDGPYSLLKCRYCGSQGIILKVGTSYKVALPKA